MAKLGLEARMTIQELARRKVGGRAIARTLEVTEGAVRYHLRRQADGAVDGRSKQEFLAAGWHDQIADCLSFCETESEPVNLALLHEWLTQEANYPGSLRSLQRYVAARFPKPRLRARRRVETPPGAQGQADWAAFGGVLIAGESRDLQAFRLKLSHSRRSVTVWSQRKDQLSWHRVHNESLLRLQGVPAVLRVDNEKTAVSHGAGSWGEINAAYRRYAQTLRFHIDACAPRSPEAKGKIERDIRSQRFWCDPRDRAWDSFEQLQAWSDERDEAMARRRICPATGTSVWDAWQEELRYLAPLPILPEPFDIAVMRPVGHDCMVAFEGRSYSVPFALVNRRVEVRGCAGTVQMLYGAEVVAVHERGTRERILIDPRHFEGESTAEVLAPLPLGRMGRRLAEIAAMAPQQRPVDLYAALAEVAR
jgi:transposase